MDVEVLDSGELGFDMGKDVFERELADADGEEKVVVGVGAGLIIGGVSGYTAWAV